MRYVRSMILAGLVLTGISHADEKQFVERWENHDEQILVHDDLARYYRKKKELNFIDMEEYRGPLAVPPGLEIETALVLYSDTDITLLLVTPKNIMKKVTLFNEQYVRTIAACAKDFSWIVSLPENRWTGVALNPYCTMEYGEEEITINLFWTEKAWPPLVDIATNSLTCTPHSLYGWNRRKLKYALKSMKCTGAKELKSFRAGPAVRQVFPAVEAGTAL